MTTKSTLELTLYHTIGCHLCEEARDLVDAAMAACGLPQGCLTHEDIAEDDALLRRFGTRIPVLREEHTGVELNWPFSGRDVLVLLTVPNLAGVD